MDLKGIMLSEISEAKTNTMGFHLYMESKKKYIPHPQNKTNKPTTNSQIQRTKWRAVDWRRDGEMDKKGERTRCTNSQLRKQSQGCKTQHSEYSKKYCNKYV